MRLKITNWFTDFVKDRFTIPFGRKRKSSKLTQRLQKPNDWKKKTPKLL